MVGVCLTVCPSNSVTISIPVTGDNPPGYNSPGDNPPTENTHGRSVTDISPLDISPPDISPRTSPPRTFPPTSLSRTFPPPGLPPPHGKHFPNYRSHCASHYIVDRYDERPSRTKQCDYYERWHGGINKDPTTIYQDDSRTWRPELRRRTEDSETQYLRRKT